MRPAIDGDSGDVARRAESTRAEHAVELIDDPLLVFSERGSEQKLPAQTKLLDVGKPAVGGERNMFHMKQHGLARIA